MCHQIVEFDELERFVLDLNVLCLRQFIDFLVRFELKMGLYFLGR